MVYVPKWYVTEHDIQVAIMKWWYNYSITLKLPMNLLFAIPNGGFRKKITAKHLKDEGVRAGIPDMMLAMHKKPFHGLFIELKRNETSKVSETQKFMLRELCSQGYCALVTRGFDATINTIMEYVHNQFWRERTAKYLNDFVLEKEPYLSIKI